MKKQKSLRVRWEISAREKLGIELRVGRVPPDAMVKIRGAVWSAAENFEYVVLHVESGKFYGVHLYTRNEYYWTEYQSNTRYFDAVGALACSREPTRQIELEGVINDSVFLVYRVQENVDAIPMTVSATSQPEPDPLETFNRSLDDEKESIARIRQNMIDKRMREAHDKALAMGHAPGTFEIVNRNGVIHTVRKGATV